MKALWLALVVIPALPALAGRPGQLKAASRALDEAIDRAQDSDVGCAKKLARRLDALQDDLTRLREGDVSTRRFTAHVRETQDWMEEACPQRFASRLGASLDTVLDALERRDADRPRHGRRDHDEDDEEDDDRRERRDRRRTLDEPQPPTLRQAPRRDCGTGADPGCPMTRGGLAPMDAETYRGFLTSVQQNPNELSKLDTVRAVLGRQALTAQQLGPVLDAFQNELLRLDAAQAAAPHLVNPQHALGFAAKWHNALLATDYSNLMSRP